MVFKNFGSAFILIDTYFKSFTKGWVLPEMEDFSCDLYVKEIYRDPGIEAISIVHLQEAQSVPCGKVSHRVVSYSQ